MPTLHREAGYTFEMVMFDCRERRHVHIKGNGKGGAKLGLESAVGMASPGLYTEHELSQIRSIIRDNLANMIEKWDPECARVEAEGERPMIRPAMIQPAIVTGVRVDDAPITFVLTDGRQVSAPTAWSRRLASASQSRRDNFAIEPGGLIVECPDLDEHVGVWTLLGISEEDAMSAAGLPVLEPADR